MAISVMVEQLALLSVQFPVGIGVEETMVVGRKPSGEAGRRIERTQLLPKDRRQ